MALVCVECSVEFAWDESPSEDRCAQYAAAWALIRGGDDQPLIRPDWHVTVCPDCGARLEMTTDDPRADRVGAGNPPGRAEVRVMTGPRLPLGTRPTEVIARPEIVTLCGSMRFLPLMLRVAAEHTAAGVIVLAPFAVVAPAEQDSQFKARLDALHRRKLDLADRVVVVSDESGYYGASTRREIAYAEALGTPVRFHRCPPLTPPAPVASAVCEVLDAELVGELAPVDRAPAPADDHGVLDAEVVEPPPYRCPLDADPVTGEYPTVLRRAGVTGPGAAAAIGASAGDTRRAWWRTLATRRPAGSRVGWW